jgi:hypothetical protein
VAELRPTAVRAPIPASIKPGQLRLLKVGTEGVADRHRRIAAPLPPMVERSRQPGCRTPKRKSRFNVVIGTSAGIGQVMHGIRRCPITYRGIRTLIFIEPGTILLP